MTKKKPCDQLAEPKNHHWIIERPNGKTSQGRCKNCGYTGDELGRTFTNTAEVYNNRRVNGKVQKIKEITIKGKKTPWRLRNW